VRPLAGLSKDKITGSHGIPADALQLILQMLIAGKFRYVLMRGTTRRARLHSFRLEAKVTEDDMPRAADAAGRCSAGCVAMQIFSSVPFANP
jgi:hypothetical protein